MNQRNELRRWERGGKKMGEMWRQGDKHLGEIRGFWLTEQETSRQWCHLIISTSLPSPQLYLHLCYYVHNTYKGFIEQPATQPGTFPFYSYLDLHLTSVRFRVFCIVHVVLNPSMFFLYNVVYTIKSGNIVTWYKLRLPLAKILGRYKKCNFRDINFNQKHFCIKIFFVIKSFLWSSL